MAGERPAHITKALQDPTHIALVDTDYKERPAHRGHTVQITGWNSTHVMLVIRSGSRMTCEAVITPAQLRELADKAEQEAPRW